MIKTVELTLSDRAKLPVRAKVSGLLCVHLNLYGGLPCGYRISHAATGLGVTQFATRKYALKFLKEIAQQPWYSELLYPYLPISSSSKVHLQLANFLKDFQEREAEEQGEYDEDDEYFFE